MTVAHRARAAPDVRALPGHVRRRRRLLADRRRRAALPRPASPGSPSSASGTAIPRRSRRRRSSSTGSGTSRTSTRPQPMEQLAEQLSDRFGGAQAFFCNSGTEAVEAAIKWARKATGRPGLVALEGSFHGRTMGALSITGQPAKRAPFEPLVPGVRFATPETLADAVGPDTAAIFLEPVQGEGGVRPLAARDARRGARARRRVRARCSSSTRCRPASAAPAQFFAWQRARRAARRGHAREGARERPSDRRAARRRRARRAASCPATTPRPSAATRSRAPRPAPSSTRSTTTCSTTCARSARASRRRSTTCAARACCSRSSSAGPALPVALAALEHGLLVGTAGETALRITPPLTISRGRGRPGDRDPPRGARVTTKYERQGAILRLVEQQHLSTQAEVAERAPRARASTPCRRRSRATSPSSGS